MQRQQLEERHEGPLRIAHNRPLTHVWRRRESPGELERRGLRFSRCADDCNIYAGSRAAVERVLAAIRERIEKYLRLPLNATKSGTGRAGSGSFWSSEWTARGKSKWPRRACN